MLDSLVFTLEGLILDSLWVLTWICGLDRTFTWLMGTVVFWIWLWFRVSEVSKVIKRGFSGDCLAFCPYLFFISTVATDFFSDILSDVMICEWLNCAIFAVKSSTFSLTDFFSLVSFTSLIRFLYSSIFFSTSLNYLVSSLWAFNFIYFSAYSFYASDFASSLSISYPSYCSYCSIMSSFIFSNACNCVLLNMSSNSCNLNVIISSFFSVREIVISFSSFFDPALLLVL